MRADHAGARDAVFADVDQALLDRLGLFTVQSGRSPMSTHTTLAPSASAIYSSDPTLP